MSDNLKRETIELIFVTLLKEGDKYGYELSQTLEERSDGLFTISASSTLLSRRRYLSMMAVSKDTPLSLGIWSVTSPEVVVRLRSSWPLR